MEVNRLKAGAQARDTPVLRAGLPTTAEVLQRADLFNGNEGTKMSKVGV